MKTYTVEYRSFDGDDVMAFEASVHADTMHDAVGQAWPGLKKDVESYGGTIDDLVAWESEPDPVHSDGGGIHTMSETRKEFYKRIESPAEGTGLYSERESVIRNLMRDAAADGYVEALRDLGTWLYGLGYDDDVFTDIATFAREHGIALEDE